MFPRTLSAIYSSRLQLAQPEPNTLMVNFFPFLYLEIQLYLTSWVSDSDTGLLFVLSKLAHVEHKSEAPGSFAFSLWSEHTPMPQFEQTPTATDLIQMIPPAGGI